VNSIGLKLSDLPSSSVENKQGSVSSHTQQRDPIVIEEEDQKENSLQIEESKLLIPIE